MINKALPEIVEEEYTSDDDLINAKIGRETLVNKYKTWLKFQNFTVLRVPAPAANYNTANFCKSSIVKCISVPSA